MLFKVSLIHKCKQGLTDRIAQLIYIVSGKQLKLIYF